MLAERFEYEILHQWSIATRSVSMMNEFLAGRSADTELFWFGVDAALGALGNISKVFFPGEKSGSRSVRRGDYMRRKYGLTEQSLLNSRKARNGFEHFDERLDKWFSGSKRKNFVDLNISPSGGISGVDSGDFARNYEIDSHTITVFGHSLDFQALYREAEGLIEQIILNHRRN